MIAQDIGITRNFLQACGIDAIHRLKQIWCGSKRPASAGVIHELFGLVQPGCLFVVDGVCQRQKKPPAGLLQAAVFAASTAAE
jgi:hypothetical protein